MDLDPDVITSDADTQRTSVLDALDVVEAKLQTAGDDSLSSLPIPHLTALASSNDPMVETMLNIQFTSVSYTAVGFISLKR